MLDLSLAAARTLLLAAQGVALAPARPATKEDVLATIRQMHVLQIDTISVVARSPYLVVWSRLGAYDPRWLEALLNERAIFEYWSHEACFLPIEDYRLYRRLMLEGRSRSYRFVRDWVAENHAQVAQMLAHVRTNGPVRSADFARTDGEASGWWNWKFEKMALEMLFASGELMIAGRHNFQRIYDLRERVLPEWHDQQAPPLETVRRTQALAAVRALGVAKAAWVADYFRTEKRPTASLVMALAAEGQLVAVQVAGWDVPGYVHPDHLALAEAAAAGTLGATYTTLLSPFDPVVWDRARARELFGFDYRIECYTPAPKRRYGYFSLPILQRGALIGRLDAKAHRKDGLFEVKTLHLEPGVAPADELIADVATALHACAAWHQTPTVVVRWSDPPELASLLDRALAQ